MGLVTEALWGMRLMVFFDHNCQMVIKPVAKNARILPDERKAEIIGDHEGPKRHLLPGIIQAAASRL